MDAVLPVLFAGVAAFGIAMYVLMDGFDLGVGILFLFAPRDQDRDTMMNSVAPFWDGNETWLVMGGVLLLAAFPVAYTVLLPAFYLPIMVMLFALVARGIAFEFRFQSERLRRLWDWVFAGGSILAAFSQGLILGGYITGVAVENGIYSGGAFDGVTLFGLACGIGVVGGYGLLGAAWLIYKANGPTQVFAREIAHAALLLTLALIVVISIWTPLASPHIATRWLSWPNCLLLSPIPITTALLARAIWASLWGAHDHRPFLLTIALFAVSYGGLAISLWPYLIPWQVTIWQGIADTTSLYFIGAGMIVIIPIILGYVGYAYWVFRGKVVPEEGYDVASTPAIRAQRSSTIDSTLHIS